MLKYLRIMVLISITVALPSRNSGRFCNPLNQEDSRKCLLQTKRCCRNLDQKRKDVLTCMERVSSVITKSTDCSCNFHPCTEEFTQGSRFKLMKSRAIRIVPPEFQIKTELILGRPIAGIETHAQASRKITITTTTPSTTSTTSARSPTPRRTKTSSASSSTTITSTNLSMATSTESTLVSDPSPTTSLDPSFYFTTSLEASPTTSLEDITSILTSLSTEAALFNEITTGNFNFGG